VQSRLPQPPQIRIDEFGPFDFEAFSHAVRLWTLVLDISVTMAQFPSKEIARRSCDYRTLGLGYANLGGLLMSSGIAYDSRQGRALCATLLHGVFPRRVLTSRRLRSCYSSEYRTPELVHPVEGLDGNCNFSRTTGIVA
jgi:hypothetical protein